MTFNFLRPGLTVNVEAKVQEQIILDSSADKQKASANCLLTIFKFRKPCCREKGGLGEKAISFQFSLIHLAAFLPAMRPNVNASVRPFPPSLFSP